MARVKFALPSSAPIFKTTLTVRINDLNYGGHVGNDSILTLAHESRVRWLTHLGLNELNLGGVGLIMSDAMIMYQGEAFLKDQLEVTLYIDDANERAFDLYAQIKRVGENENNIARLKMGHLFFDYRLRKMARASNEILNLLARSCC